MLSLCQICAFLTLLLVSLSSLFTIDLLAKPDNWHGVGGAKVIGEERITGGWSARRLAERMVREANAIWSQPASDWSVVSENRLLKVEAVRIDGGEFASSGVLLTRAKGIIVNATASATIQLLTSPAGFAIIDPLSSADDFGKYYAKYWWRWGQRLVVADARAEVPGLAPREFSVLNAIDVNARVFVSKSILHASRPGGSEYNTHRAPPPPNGRVRALNTYAVRTTPRGDDCVVEMINFADLGGSFPRRLMNVINGLFLNRVYKRLQESIGVMVR
jgi:hypothetical protein